MEGPDYAQVGGTILEGLRTAVNTFFCLLAEIGTKDLLTLDLNSYSLSQFSWLNDKQGKLSQWYIISSVFIQHFFTFDHHHELLSFGKF
jgi:hypothetical protein